MKYPRCLLLLNFLLANVCLADDGSSQVEALVAKVFRVPEEYLDVKEINVEKDHKDPEIIKAYSVNSKENSMPEIRFAIAKKGRVLTKKLESGFEERLRANPQPFVSRIELPKGVRGYTGMVGVGPGGSEELVVATDDDKKVDYLVKISIPGDPPLTGDEKLGKYFDDLWHGEKTEAMTQHLVEALRAFVVFAQSHGYDLPSRQ